MKYLYCVFLFACSLSFFGFANPTDDKLLFADSIKHSDPLLLANTLQSISAEQLTPNQFEFYEYLTAHSEFYQGSIEQSNTRLDQLVTNANTEIKYHALISLLDFNRQGALWLNGTKHANTLANIIDEIRNLTIQELALAELTIFYNQIGDHDKSLNFAHQLEIKTSDPALLCTAIANKIVGLLSHQPQVVSKVEVGRAKNQCDVAGDAYWKSLIVLHYAKTMLSGSEAQQALNSLIEELTEVENSQNTSLISLYYAYIGKAYLQLGDYNSANLYGSRSVASFDSSDHRESAMVAFDTLFQVAERNNFKRQALIFHKSFYAASARYFESIKQKQIAIQQSKLNSQENLMKISRLNQENRLLKTKAEIEHGQVTNNRLALALAFTLIVLLVFWSYRSKRSQNRLKVQANTDELTGIATRLSFRHVANIRLLQDKGSKRESSLILFDLDLFKQVNDKYGHTAGDIALKAAVDCALDVCRSEDLVARIGGEEFAILVSNCNVSQASHVAEQCRQKIEKLSFESLYPDLKITSSFGVADTSNGGYVLDNIFAKADQALFKAKSNGRNNVQSL